MSVGWVWLVSITRFTCQQIAVRLWVAVTKSRGDTMAHTTIIGIDVSKNFADACAISAQGEVMLETKIFYDTVGLQHF